MTEQVEPKDMTKDQLKLFVLKDRIGQITSNYEDQIADIRANWTQAEQAFQNALQSQEKQLESLQEQLRKANESLQQNQETPATS
jgi:uncharacterized protein YukE